MIDVWLLAWRLWCFRWALRDIFVQLMRCVSYARLGTASIRFDTRRRSWTTVKGKSYLPGSSLIALDHSSEARADEVKPESTK